MSKYSPFKFLEPYQKEDRGQFFGREDEIEALYKLVLKSKIMLLYGVSGVGKTSLIRCGLANRFDDTQWLALFIRRGKHFLQSLQQAIAQKMAEEPVEETYDLNEELVDLYEDNGDAEKISDRSDEANLQNLYLRYFKPIYLIFDQFEEIFTLGNREEQQQFFEFLAKLSKSKLNLRVILVMREEYFANLDRFEDLVPRLSQNRLRVEKMSASTLELVTKNMVLAVDNIKLPKTEAEQITLFNLIVKQLTKDGLITVEPTYLQIYLDQLYRNTYHKGQAYFNSAEVKRMRDIDTVLDRFLEEQIGELNQGKDQEKAWTLLMEMITIEGTKKPMPKEKLIQLLEKI